ncbi:GNAT family N-acetyltransferase [Clostridium sp. D2Q-11]|uniref:GNAT family N-acetyltransferase n=1 Tax=Anaeromonas frigoriresistens TaxID=2683708 RepID=A0A942UVT0_9FIRM|nr:GNAT family N-acetyltransferase [Anaeromonas frigoriresistens]MBS4537724.1 GNAT family N-acetyltransferase [Anaeromonas frigoriresistens]
MIKELSKDKYCEVYNLIKNDKFPEATSVILKNNPGWIFVDNINNPKTALIFCKGMGGFYLLGDYTNTQFKSELLSFVEEVVYSRLNNIGISWIEISGVSEEWNRIIEEVFSNKNLGKDKQLVYKLKNEISISEKSIENIRLFNKNTFNLQISNIDFLKNETQKFWGNIENFMNKGICSYYLIENEIVSICYSGLVKGNIHTVGIETLEKHRRKGYGYKVAKAFIKECRMKGIELHWDCSEDNDGSKSMAEKLGLEKEYDYTCYWYKF